ncbi:MAG: YraN family protein [Cytophagales bacterium]|nr:YraN family protein [Armatimonadota bacterium]
MDTRRQKGNQGEAAAQALLERQGYRIVDVNVRFGSRRDGLPGEIDIVAWDGPTLCFVEVKARRGNTFATPYEAVTPAKQRQIARLALAYAAHHGLLGDAAEVPLRFDIVAVTLSPGREDPGNNGASSGVVSLVRRAELVRGAFLAPDDFADGF